MSADAYEIGYKKPPRGRQWVKGQSGNPNGRPKRAVSLDPIAEIIDEILMRKITVPSTRGRVTMLELILKQLLNHMCGKRRKKALQVWRKYEEFAKSKPVTRTVVRKTKEEEAKENANKASLYEEYLRSGIAE